MDKTMSGQVKGPLRVAERNTKPTIVNPKAQILEANSKLRNWAFRIKVNCCQSKSQNWKQNFATILKGTLDCWKSKIYKEKSAVNFFYGPPKMYRLTENPLVFLKDCDEHTLKVKQTQNTLI